jgi:hypothetical protein
MISLENSFEDDSSIDMENEKEIELMKNTI